MPPVIVPTVHVNVLATLAVKVIADPAPLQIVFVAAVVTVGAGNTVTVVVKAFPIQPLAEVGVTMY